MIYPDLLSEVYVSHKLHFYKTKSNIAKSFFYISNTERDSTVSSKFRCHFSNKMIVKL